jgi:predicted Zn finger-like uncharacterized protein
MTMFRVVPDQLRISEGWVRCGQCDDIFDATVHMQALIESLAAPKPAQKDEVQPAFSPDVPIETITRPSEVLRIEPTLDGAHEFESSHSALHIERQRSSDETIVSDTFIEELAFGDESPQTVMTEGVHQPSFMRSNPSASMPRKPWVSACLYFTALLLSAGLIVQALLYERDRIAAQAPALKPLLQALCEWMQCKISPMRQIESIVIDSSSFNKLSGDVYRLNFTLKNTALIALALPAIELSLTDVQDQALMRRVINPDVLGFKLDHLAPISESSASLTLSVNKQEGVDRVAGYRILAFYP